MGKNIIIVVHKAQAIETMTDFNIESGSTKLRLTSAQMIFGSTFAASAPRSSLCS